MKRVYLTAIDTYTVHVPDDVATKDIEKYIYENDIEPNYCDTGKMNLDEVYDDETDELIWEPGMPIDERTRTARVK